MIIISIICVYFVYIVYVSNLKGTTLVFLRVLCCGLPLVAEFLEHERADGLQGDAAVTGCAEYQHSARMLPSCGQSVNYKTDSWKFRLLTVMRRHL